jgi:hypothetical protein
LFINILQGVHVIQNRLDPVINIAAILLKYFLLSKHEFSSFSFAHRFTASFIKKSFSEFLFE